MIKNLDKFNSYRSVCGGTPLIEISKNIYGKLETYNPTGSVKDRMVSYVVSRALESGDISNDTILCEATSGNTGIALSAVAAALGLECRIFMPRNMSDERKQMMTIYGATLVDAPDDDFEEAIRLRDAFINSTANAWSPKQFSNAINIECHRNITAPEIHQQLYQRSLSWSAFVHGSGTGGTIEGVRQYCKNNSADTEIVMTVPFESPHGIQGIGDGRDFLADPDNMGGTIIIKTSDAIKRAQDFTRSTGILVGISSGANILAAEEYLYTNNPKGVVVTMLCDRGERYMTIYGG